MFAHILSLIIQNRFHLLLKLLLLSIRNSWSDVLSAPLFVAAVSFFVARAKFQVGVLAPEVFRCEKSTPATGFTVGVLVFAVLFHLHERSVLHEYFGHWWDRFQSNIAQKEKMRRDVKLLYDAMVFTSKGERCEFAAR